MTCAVKTVKISLRPSGRGPGRVRSNNESTNHTKTDGAGDPPSGERRADRKGDLFAVRDAQLSEVSPTLGNRGGGFRPKKLDKQKENCFNAGVGWLVTPFHCFNCPWERYPRAVFYALNRGFACWRAKLRRVARRISESMRFLYRKGFGVYHVAERWPRLCMAKNLSNAITLMFNSPPILAHCSFAR